MFSARLSKTEIIDFFIGYVRSFVPELMVFPGVYGLKSTTELKENVYGSRAEFLIAPCIVLHIRNDFKRSLPHTFSPSKLKALSDATIDERNYFLSEFEPRLYSLTFATS